jgi:orotidine-5'-phosphate decarboxylase
MADVNPSASKARPIVALDVASPEGAHALTQQLGNSCRFYKVGSELFTAGGPGVVRALRDAGNEVFLDLKFHDIPNTVSQAVRSAARLGASLVTVHASGGARMLEAAVEAGGADCRVLAVTVLTSLDGEGLAAAWGREGGVSVEAEVLRLAGAAQSAGAHGVVCGGLEAAAVSGTFGESLAILVPGIRFADGAVHDQARVMTPGRAVAAGARYLVLGRAVTAAPDPRAAMDRALAEIAAVRVG